MNTIWSVACSNKYDYNTICQKNNIIIIGQPYAGAVFAFRASNLLAAEKSNCDYVNNMLTHLNNVFLYTAFLNHCAILSCSHACTKTSRHQLDSATKNLFVGAVLGGQTIAQAADKMCSPLWTDLRKLTKLADSLHH